MHSKYFWTTNQYLVMLLSDHTSDLYVQFYNMMQFQIVFLIIKNDQEDRTNDCYDEWSNKGHLGTDFLIESSTDQVGYDLAYWWYNTVCVNIPVDVFQLEVD